MGTRMDIRIINRVGMSRQFSLVPLYLVPSLGGMGLGPLGTCFWRMPCNVE